MDPVGAGSTAAVVVVGLGDGSPATGAALASTSPGSPASGGSLSDETPTPELALHQTSVHVEAPRVRHRNENPRLACSLMHASGSPK